MSTTAVAVHNPKMQLAYFTARQHAIGAAYVHKMRNSQEEMLDRLETEYEDEVYRRVCRRLGFDPLAESEGPSRALAVVTAGGAS